MLEDTLKLMLTVANRAPAARLSRQLEPLFRIIAVASSPDEAARVEEQIWSLWLEHPVDDARLRLERAIQSINDREFEAAAAQLDEIVERYPDYAEAWNKRATLRFLQQRDGESLRDIERTLELEPRHFGAICGLAQICLRRDRHDLALFALQRAQQLHPTLASVRDAIAELSTRAHGVAN